MTQESLDQLCINTLRTLSIDAVQKAQSGHPGSPMGIAPTAYCLWQRFLRYDPDDPDWLNRDRFVLSPGHACALLYSLLHVCAVKDAAAGKSPGQGLAVTLDDLKTFRQLDSRCSGHPEYGHTKGVETTTGPLGQGAATSVGMAMAQRWLAATYNRPGYPLFDHNVYVVCSDGDVMEGVCNEAASLAGHMKLSGLCWIYDSNRISIEGPTSLTFTEDVAGRFTACGWSVHEVSDANDLAQLNRGYQAFLDTHDRPTLIIVHSHIGYGAPHKQDTREAHGEPLGADEVRLAKQFYGCDPDVSFDIPAGVLQHFSANFGQRGARAHAAWKQLFAAYKKQYPDLARQIELMKERELPQDWEAALPIFDANSKGLATRDSSGQVLNALATRIPWLLGGSADLWPSTKTNLKAESFGQFQAPAPEQHDASYSGRNMHFGLREHAMCAIGSGLSLSGLRSYVSSFLIFSDYGRPALRLSAMMQLPLITIWTHDSISLGEDGPTHQPIEQLASLRAMPGMLVLRPADANEVVEAWRLIMQLKNQPVCLVLTRQALPTLDRSQYASAQGLARGGYILAEAPYGKPDVLLIATGSEVALCVAAYEQLKVEGINARVVSMPSWELFENQSEEYRNSVLPASIRARVAVEEASTFGWERYAGNQGTILGMHTFGLSAPLKALTEHFGFNTENVVVAAKAQLKRHASL